MEDKKLIISKSIILHTTIISNNVIELIIIIKIMNRHKTITINFQNIEKQSNHSTAKMSLEKL